VDASVCASAAAAAFRLLLQVMWEHEHRQPSTHPRRAPGLTPGGILTDSFLGLPA